MAGVNLPSHFMIRPAVEGVELLVDAYHDGEVLCLEEAEQRLSAIMGLNVQVRGLAGWLHEAHAVGWLHGAAWGGRGVADQPAIKQESAR
jgi:hypothetical protein